MEIAEKPVNPPQHQDTQPGIESMMHPKPVFINEDYVGSNKLEGKVAIVTGGDSGIGRAVAVHYAVEGADVVVAYLNEHADAEETKGLIEATGKRCVLVSGDIGDETFCKKLVERTISEFTKLDIVVNNAAVQFPQHSITQITQQQLEDTFRINIFAMFYLVKAALPYLKEDSHIINTTSVTAYRGSAGLLDYSSTKGAIVSFTRSLSQQLAEKKIYVNAVAPGPIWTPLIPASFDEKRVSTHGSDVPLKRVGQPGEMGPAYVYLACKDSSYMTGQILHLNGGEVVNG